MSFLSAAALFSIETAAVILERGLEVATVLGLPVSTWRAGDPTRSLYKFLAETLGALEGNLSEYVKAGFLSTASDDWLTVLAEEVYGVERTEASYVTIPEGITLTNTGGGNYPIEIGELTVKASSTGKTYHNTNADTITPSLASITFDLIADEEGSDSAVDVDEIDEFVTTYLGVEIVSSLAGTAQDEQGDDALKEQCRATLGALSPNGPADAYEYVVRNQELTGVTDITRAQSSNDSPTNEVTVYVASPTGAVAGASVTAAQAAVDEWAEPLCTTATVISAVAVELDVDVEISGEDIPAEFEDLISTAIQGVFAGMAIGADVARSEIVTAVTNALKAAGATGLSVVVTDPSADTTAIAANEVPALGVLTVTEV